MTALSRKLVTVITEAVIESVIVDKMRELGAKGYTATDCRGEGSRGARSGPGELSRNVRIEVVCDAETARRITEALHTHFYDDYAMIAFVADVSVLRPEKF